MTNASNNQQADGPVTLDRVLEKYLQPPTPPVSPQSDASFALIPADIGDQGDQDDSHHALVPAASVPATLIPATATQQLRFPYITPAAISFGQECINTTRTLLETLDQDLQEYCNSSPLTSAGQQTFGFPDMLLAAAITQSTVMLVGDSGTAKTLVCRLAMRSLFGAEAVERDITEGLSQEEFLDIDMGVIRNGGRLQDAYQALPIITGPAKLFNEINRAQPSLQNIFIPLLDNCFSPLGKDVACGLQYGGGAYQWVLMTMNRGADYSGTSPVDRAVQERVALTIPMEEFMPGVDDNSRMVRAQQPSRGSQGQGPSGLTAGPRERQTQEHTPAQRQHIGELLCLHLAARSIPLEEDSIALATYLLNLDHCVKATGYRKAAGHSLAECEGCAHAKPNKGLCGLIRAPSARSVCRWISYTAGFALVRAARTGVPADKLAITPDDLVATAPLTLYDRMPVRPEALDGFSGQAAAINYVVRNCRRRCDEFLATAHGRQYLLGGDLTAAARKDLERYAMDKDPWAVRIDDMRACR